MSGKLVTAALVIFVLALAVPFDASAQTSGSGIAVYVPHGEMVQEFSGGSTVVRFSQQGFSLADDPNDPLHMVSFDCAGVTAMTAAGQTSHGHCDGVNTDGDTYSLWWRGDDTGGDWGFIAGTGKFSGINGGGTYQPAAEWPDGKNAVRWTSEWALQ
jgi:hypothetical protein